MKYDIYLTEHSLKRLLEGKNINNDGTIIHPPKTNELGLMQISTLKAKLQQVKKILSIYETYSDQIEFTKEDIELLDSEELNKV